MSVACVNYDFAKNWQKSIVPLLKTEMTHKLIKHIQEERKLSHDYPENIHYVEDKAPASMLTSYDSHCTMIDTMVKTAIKKQDPRLPLELITAYKKLMPSADECVEKTADKNDDKHDATNNNNNIATENMECDDPAINTVDEDISKKDITTKNENETNNDDFDDDIDSDIEDDEDSDYFSDDFNDDDSMDEDEHWEKYSAVINQIQDLLGCNYKKNREHMVHWTCFGCCHWFNKYICMYWATKVCPQIHWKLLRTDTHTTVVSHDGKLMFDLLAFCYNRDRFQSYCCNQTYQETDPSLGANESIKLMMNNKSVRWSTLLKRSIEFDPIRAMVEYYAFN